MILYIVFFCSFDFWAPFFISPRYFLNSFWLFFTSASLISPFLILSITSTALSYLSNSSLHVLPLYLYINSSRLTFLSNSVISLSLLYASSLNISFCFETHGLSSSSKAYFLIVLSCPCSLNAFICFSRLSLIVFICCSKAFPNGE